MVVRNVTVACYFTSGCTGAWTACCMRLAAGMQRVLTPYTVLLFWLRMRVVDATLSPPVMHSRTPFRSPVQ